MSYKRKRKEKRARQTKLGLSTIVVVVVLLFVLFGVGQRQGTPLDASLCPLDGDFASHVAVLLDPSDRLNVTQRRDVARELLDLLEGVPEKTELRIYSVRRATTGATRPDTVESFRICRPRDPEDIGKLEQFWVNTDIVGRKYEEYEDTVRESLSELMDEQEADVSPILEAIQTVVLDAFPTGDSVPRRLLLVSDMVQNSAGLSFFRDEIDFRKFSRNPEYRRMRADLEGIVVEVWFLARGGNAGRLQEQNLRNFWEEYAIDREAKDFVWDDVTG